MENKLIPIELIYAKQRDWIWMGCTVLQGTDIQTALVLSGIIPEIEALGNPLNHIKVGIWGEVKPLDYHLHAFDRIEIYQPLFHDPKDRRRNKAKEEALSLQMKRRLEKQKTKHLVVMD